MANAKKELGARAEQTVHLDVPLKRGEQTIESITIREPLASDLMGLKLTELASLEVDSLRKLLPRISTPMLTEVDVTRLNLADLLQCGGAIAHFLVPSAMRPAMPSPIE